MGGNEIISESFAKSVQQAVEASLARMFPRFLEADHKGWDTAMRRASEGGSDPLSALDFTGEVDSHPVCQEIWKFLDNNGRKGSEVRRHFAESPYGWPQDAVDGALLSLLNGGSLKATRNGLATTAKGMTRQQIGVTDFAREGVTISVNHRMAVRKLATATGFTLQGGKEGESLGDILAHIRDQANAAGGDTPLPLRPDNSLILNLLGTTGNQQIVEVADRADELIVQYQAWSEAAKVIQERLPTWSQLSKFLRHARHLEGTEDLALQARAVQDGRNLLDEVNPISPLLNQVTSALRQAVSEKYAQLDKEREREVTELENQEGWSKAKEEERQKNSGVQQTETNFKPRGGKQRGTAYIS